MLQKTPLKRMRWMRMRMTRWRMLWRRGLSRKWLEAMNRIPIYAPHGMFLWKFDEVDLSVIVWAPFC
jgi:hypothetical protein